MALTEMLGEQIMSSFPKIFIARRYGHCILFPIASSTCTQNHSEKSEQTFKLRLRTVNKQKTATQLYCIV